MKPNHPFIHTNLEVQRTTLQSTPACVVFWLHTESLEVPDFVRLSIPDQPFLCKHAQEEEIDYRKDPSTCRRDKNIDWEFEGPGILMMYANSTPNNTTMTLGLNRAFQEQTVQGQHLWFQYSFTLKFQNVQDHKASFWKAHHAASVCVTHRYNRIVIVAIATTMNRMQHSHDGTPLAFHWLTKNR